jgi:trigger factor
VHPKVDLKKAQDGEDWEVQMLIAEKPTIDLGNYKEVVKKAKAESKKADIWLPPSTNASVQAGKDKVEKKPEANSQNALNEVLSALIKHVKIEISDLIVEHELEQRLTRLVDDIQKIGMSADAYLKSKNMTMDDLRNQFRTEIEETYKLEFMLMEIADLEKLQVEKEDLDKLFAHIKTDAERKDAEANAYFYAGIIRKQKTIDYLLGL